jgi:hypothetical protein
MNRRGVFKIFAELLATLAPTEHNQRVMRLAPTVGGPIFIPRKHTVCSYRAQQRAADKRRRARN